MALPTIVGKDDPVLRGKAAHVPVEEISSPRIQGIIKKMKEALDSQDDGVGIAAPQIGEPLAIFIVSRKVFEHLAGESDSEEPKKEFKDLVCINPKILKLSKERRWMEEGCLSVRYLYGKVHRSVRATIRAYDEYGKAFERGGSGLLAQIFQHETDHLAGALFIDTAKDVEDIPPEKMEQRNA